MSRLARRCLLVLGLAVMAAPAVMAVQRQTAWSVTAPNLYSFRYLLYLPPGYNTDATARWPLMVFLHGAGERGTDVERVAVNGPPLLIERGAIIPASWSRPCVPVRGGRRRSAAVHRGYREAVSRRCRRVYLTGLSMGGYGTWDLATRSPGFYAAIAPLCGGGTPSQAYQLRDLPVWAFHGALDATVPVIRTQEMIDAIRQAGGSPSVTIYPNLGHDVWTVTYGNEALYTWLFEQSRENLPTLPTGNVPPPVSVPVTPAPPPARRRLRTSLLPPVAAARSRRGLWRRWPCSESRGGRGAPGPEPILRFAAGPLPGGGFEL